MDGGSRRDLPETENLGPPSADPIPSGDGGGATPPVARRRDATTGTSGDSSGGPGLVYPPRIGPYRILDVLGEGGMGVVYRAEQTEPVERVVALKVVRASLTNPAVSARFAAERQALARLSHPSVAQIFEAGKTDEGYPYFAMELVEGETLIEFCDARRLAVRARLELFMTVCRGVEHAHQKGILHRDLKPSNILVTEIEGRPVPKIIDFGIAKALDRPLTDVTQLTADGVVGTPAYMSPEALRPAGEGGGVDTRADVYALGILLYELLAGTRPFEARGVAGFAEMLRAISEDEAPRPSVRLRAFETEVLAAVAERRQVAASSLIRRLEGDLDWIVTKAIARRPEERYGSAAELASEVERHLLDLPVLAKPPSVAYRLRKLVRRHRVATVAAILVAVSLVLGIAGTSIGLLRAQREAERAAAEAARTRAALEDAEEVTEFLVGLFNVTDSGQVDAQEVTAQQILDNGSERIETTLVDQPLRRARLLYAIGRSYYFLEAYPEAERRFQESLALRERELPANHPDIAKTLSAIAKLEGNRLQLEAATQAARRALAILDAAAEPDPSAIAAALGSLGEILVRGGDLEEAEAVTRRALEEQEKAAQPDPLATADLWETLGTGLLEQARYPEAASAYEKGLELREQELGPDDLRVAAALINLGTAYGGTGKRSEALALQERAVAIYEASGMNSRALAISLNNLGIEYRDLGRFDDAERCFRRARTIFVEVLGPTNPWVGNPLTDLGVLYWQLGRLDEAEPLLQRALKLWEKNPGEKHPWTAWPLWGLGNVYRDMGRLAEAEPYYRRALAIRRAALPADDPDLRDARTDYAKLLRALGREDEAAALLAPAEPE